MFRLSDSTNASGEAQRVPFESRWILSQNTGLQRVDALGDRDVRRDGRDDVLHRDVRSSPPSAEALRGSAAGTRSPTVYESAVSGVSSWLPPKKPLYWPAALFSTSPVPYWAGVDVRDHALLERRGRSRSRARVAADVEQAETLCLVQLDDARRTDRALVAAAELDVLDRRPLEADAVGVGRLVDRLAVVGPAILTRSAAGCRRRAGPAGSARAFRRRARSRCSHRSGRWSARPGPHRRPSRSSGRRAVIEARSRSSWRRTRRRCRRWRSGA